MKKKFSILLILVVAVLTLAVVGYAGWYITRDPKTQDGNVEAYTVDSSEITVALCNSTGGDTDVPQNIIFGHPETMSNASAWLKFDGATSADQENLTVYVKITTLGAGHFTINCQMLTSLDPVTAAAATNLFAGPSYVLEDNDSGKVTLTNTNELSFSAAATAVVSVSYSWKFTSNNNPYVYFNGKGKNTVLTPDDYTFASSTLGVTGLTDGTSTYKDFANKYLTQLKAYTDAVVKFRITVADFNA